MDLIDGNSFASFGIIRALLKLASRERIVEPTLVVIGISYRTAALAVRERFWMDEGDRGRALTTLVRSEGIDEIVVFASCNRTEFYVWTQNAAEAANSILRFLTRSYNLKLSDWSNFYRLVGDAAMTHIFRVAAALDTQVYGEAEVIPSLTNAWHQAQRLGTTGCFLDGILGHALEVANLTSKTIKGSNCIISVARAAVEQSQGFFPDLQSRKVLILGAGRMAESIVKEMRSAGAEQITLTNRTSQRVDALAAKLNVNTIPYEQRWTAMAESDVVVIATNARKFIVTIADVSTVMKGRVEHPLAIIDVSVPRNVEPAVRAMDCVYLADVDDLAESVRNRKPSCRELAEAEDTIRLEAADFNNRLMRERLVPTITALRERLQELCDQELNSLSDQFGPFTEDQNEAMRAYAAHIAQRISATIARQIHPATLGQTPEGLAESLSRILSEPGALSCTTRSLQKSQA
jgi:glutamyl-tRNA reductase